jgi:hypothetical protein
MAESRRLSLRPNSRNKAAQKLYFIIIKFCRFHMCGMQKDKGILVQNNAEHHIKFMSRVFGFVS